MTMLLSILIVMGLVLGAYVVGWFVLSLILERNDIADIAWGPGIALMASTALIAGNALTLQSGILLALVWVWGLRLALRVGLRVFSHSEDERYAQWRREWQWLYVRSFFQVYLLQGVLMVVVAYPFVHYSAFSGGMALHAGLFGIGIAVWAVGFFFEVVGDYQLARFLHTPKQERKGAVLDTGLWKYTRHPNYFGEVMLWWGVWLAVVGVPYGAVAVLGPATVTILIFFVSGIPMLEKGMAGNEAYEAYKKRTSMFLPLPPKRQ
jgi:steroid 5-alpha reductase family enzyme